MLKMWRVRLNEDIIGFVISNGNRHLVTYYLKYILSRKVWVVKVWTRFWQFWPKWRPVKVDRRYNFDKLFIYDAIDVDASEFYFGTTIPIKGTTQKGLTIKHLKALFWKQLKIVYRKELSRDPFA